MLYSAHIFIQDNLVTIVTHMTFSMCARILSDSPESENKFNKKRLLRLFLISCLFPQ